MALVNHKQPESLPQKLDKEEIKDPFLVVHRFFDYANINQQRQYLWEWHKTMIAGTFNSELLDARQRYNMIYFYEHLEKLIEAANLINTQQLSAKHKRQKSRTRIHNS